MLETELIIWDWNGTLLNDVDISVKAMNKILTKYKLPQITTEKYKEIFTFPVKKYYEKAGFDFNKYSFKIIGMEFINIYNETFKQANLQNNAPKVLEYFKSKNIKQIVMSARENNSLQNDIKHYKIDKYFDKIVGISNNYAKGKEDLFSSFFYENKVH